MNTRRILVGLALVRVGGRLRPNLCSCLKALLPICAIGVICGSLFAGSGGPDSFGYHWYDDTDAPYDWIDTSGGTQVSDFDSPVNIGFDFNFYGTNYNQCYVNKNGTLSFSSVFTDTPNAHLPTGSGPAKICPWWYLFSEASADPDWTLKSKPPEVYIFAGYDGLAVNEIVKYDPSAETTTVLPTTLPGITRSFYTPFYNAISSVWDPDNMCAYVFGGHDGTNYLDDIIKFDPISETATIVDTLPSARTETSAVWDPDNKCAYIFGGVITGGVYLNQIVKWDPANPPPTILGTTFPTPGARGRTKAVWDPTGDPNPCAYVFGGQRASGYGGYLKNIVKFDPTAGSTDNVASTPGTYGRCFMSAVWDPVNNRAYTFGGIRASGGPYTYEIMQFTPPDTAEILGNQLPSKLRWSSAVWDKINDRALIFGGHDIYRAAVIDDIVEFDGSAATTLSVALPVSRSCTSAVWGQFGSLVNPAYGYPSMSYDSDRQVCVLVCENGLNVNETLEWDGTNWTLSATNTSNLSSRSGALCYDDTNDETLSYGGASGGTARNFTSVWNGTSWTYKNKTAPGTRYGHGLVHHPNPTQSTWSCLMFGGYNQRQDTWQWDGTDWHQLFPAAPIPSGRKGHGMAYDPDRDRTVLFGGHATGAANSNNETWEWDGIDWTEITTAAATAPSARGYMMMAYDSARKKMVLFGGTDTSSTKLDDTWEYDGTTNTWTEVYPAHHPLGSESYIGTMAYDTHRKKGVLYNHWKQTWEYGGWDWAPITATYQTSGTSPNRKFVMTYDYTQPVFQVVLYEGSNYIRVNYQDTGGPAPNVKDGTIGIENPDGSVGLEYTCNGSPSTVTNTSSLLFTMPTKVEMDNLEMILAQASGTELKAGMSNPMLKFTLATNRTGTTAKWRRFRVDLSPASTIDGSKVEVQVWRDDDGDGNWAATDQLVGYGRFDTNSNRTVYLDTQLHSVNDTATYYFIVYKIDGDVAGGSRAGVEVSDATWLEFDDDVGVSDDNFGFISEGSPLVVKNAEFTSAQSGDWDDPNTWDLMAVPPAGDPVQVQHTITVKGNRTCGNLTIDEGVILELDTTAGCELKLDDGATLYNNGEIRWVGDDSNTATLTSAGTAIHKSAEAFSNRGGGDWDYYRPITVTNSTGSALTNHQIVITLTTTALGNPYANINEDGFDIRFTASDKTTEISYWIESWDNTGDSVIWVKVPDLPTGDSYIYIYYGNTSASPSSNGDDTFIFFDDFTGTTIDTSKWVETDTGGNISQNDELIIANGTGAWGPTCMYSVPNFNRASLIARAKYRSTCVTGASYKDTTMLWWKDTTAGTSYVNFIYALYFNKPVAGGYNLHIREDGIDRGLVGSFIANTQYWVRQILKSASGAITQISTDGSAWSGLYDSSFSTESPLKVGFTHYQGGTVYIDNFLVRKYASSEPAVAAPGTEQDAVLGGGVLNWNNLTKCQYGNFIHQYQKFSVTGKPIGNPASAGLSTRICPPDLFSE